MEDGKWVKLECAGDGVIGTSLKLIKFNNENNLAFCGMKVYGEEIEKDQEIEQLKKELRELME